MVPASEGPKAVSRGGRTAYHSRMDCHRLLGAALALSLAASATAGDRVETKARAAERPVAVGDFDFSELLAPYRRAEERRGQPLDPDTVLAANGLDPSLLSFELKTRFEEAQGRPADLRALSLQAHYAGEHVGGISLDAGTPGTLGVAVSGVGTPKDLSSEGPQAQRNRFKGTGLGRLMYLTAARMAAELGGKEVVSSPIYWLSDDARAFWKKLEIEGWAEKDRATTGWRIKRDRLAAATAKSHPFFLQRLKKPDDSADRLPAAALAEFEPHSVAVADSWLRFSDFEIDESIASLLQAPNLQAGMTISRVGDDLRRSDSTVRRGNVRTFNPMGQLPDGVQDKLTRFAEDLYRLYARAKGREPQKVVLALRATSDTRGVRVDRELGGDAESGLHDHFQPHRPDVVDFVLALRGPGSLVKIGDEVRSIETGQVVFFGSKVLHGSPASQETRLIVLGSIEP